MSHLFGVADAVRLPFADRSIDLVIGSPPYLDRRTYGIKAKRKIFAWVEWMLAVTAEALRVSRGPVIWVAAGSTEKRNYQPACEGLMWEWFRRGPGVGVIMDGLKLPGSGGSMYRPVYWARNGISGSGGDQWFRADVEYCMCFKRPGRLPWTNNTAKGHPPKWAPGGEMSHRLSDGRRVNQWGGGPKSASTRRVSGVRQSPGRPSHIVASKASTKRRPSGDMEFQEYIPPAIANPGNMFRTKTGGGNMGHPLAHELGESLIRAADLSAASMTAEFKRKVQAPAEEPARDPRVDPRVRDRIRLSTMEPGKYLEVPQQEANWVMCRLPSGDTVQKTFDEWRSWTKGAEVLIPGFQF
jgi:hypothetical protein